MRKHKPKQQDSRKYFWMLNENPYAPPDDHVTYALHADPNSVQGIYRQKNQLVMHRDSHLPARCVKSAASTDGHHSVKFVHTSPWLALLIFGGLPGMIGYFLIRHFAGERIVVKIPLSEQQSQKRTNSIRYAWTTSLVAGLLFLSCVLWICCALWIIPGQRTPVPSIPFLVMVLSVIVAVISAIIAATKKRILSITKTTKTHIWLGGVAPSLLDELPTFP